MSSASGQAKGKQAAAVRAVNDHVKVHIKMIESDCL